MRRYFVKQHYVATDSNVNFAGETKDYLVGKEEFILNTLNPCKWESITWGYTRLQDVVRAYRKHSRYAEEEQKHGFWTITTVITYYDYD